MSTTYRTPHAFMVRIQPGGGPGDQVPAALRSDHIMVGWHSLPQLVDQSLVRDDFRDMMRREYSAVKVSDTLIGKWVGDAWRFIREMRVGDIVIVPQGRNLYLAEIAGHAYHDGSFAHLDTAIRRRVRWLNAKQPVPRAAASPALRRTLRARQTCIDVSSHLAEIHGFAGIKIPFDCALPD